MKIIAEIRTITKSSHLRSRQSRLASGWVLRLGVLCALPLFTAACVYRMPIRQGNYLDPTAIAQVKAGMTHSQVRFLLGTPQVPGGFNDARWDYDYYLNLHHLANPRREHVVVWFDKGLVARVQSDVTSAPETTETHGGIKYPVPY